MICERTTVQTRISSTCATRVHVFAIPDIGCLFISCPMCKSVSNAIKRAAWTNSCARSMYPNANDELRTMSTASGAFTGCGDCSKRDNAPICLKGSGDLIEKKRVVQEESLTFQVGTQP